MKYIRKASEVEAMQYEAGKEEEFMSWISDSFLDDTPTKFEHGVRIEDNDRNLISFRSSDWAVFDESGLNRQNAVEFICKYECIK